MKKAVLVLLCGIMIFTLVSCGGSSKPAKVTLADGTIEEITADELLKKFDENEVAFYEKYNLADITFEGTVDSIEKVNESGLPGSQIEIIFKEGWEIEIPYDTDNTKMISEVNKGDKLKVSSTIDTCDVMGYVSMIYSTTGEGVKIEKL